MDALQEALAAAQVEQGELLASAIDAEGVRARYRGVLQISIDLARGVINEAEAQARFDAWAAA